MPPWSTTLASTRSAATGCRTPVILDITSGPVATADYSLEISDSVGNPRRSPRAEPLPEAAAPGGIGMQCAATDQFGYAQVEVTKSKLTVDLLDIDDEPVLDTGDVSQAGAKPCAGSSSRRSNHDNVADRQPLGARGAYCLAAAS